MLDLYEEKFPYDYTREEIIKGLNDFSKGSDKEVPPTRTKSFKSGSFINSFRHLVNVFDTVL